MRGTRLVPTVVAALVVLLLFTTLGRARTPSGDVQLYASIARSIQLIGVGVPSEIRNSPLAVDHLPFYGPVYFHLVAASFRTLGVSVWSLRIVSLFGALLFAAAGVALAGAFSGPECSPWVAPLLLMAPEVRAYGTMGKMDMIAVGLETLALAAFARGVNQECAVGPYRRSWYGLAGGLCLGLAALTTPRTYPFVIAFGTAGLWMLASGGTRRVAARQVAVTVAVCSAILLAWASATHGSPVAWARYMTFILTHENTDVAVLPTATRQWSFAWSNVVTPFLAVAGAGAATWLLARRREDPPWTRALAFALGAAGVSLMLTVTVMNLTFWFRTYFGLPLFAVVVAAPWQRLGVAAKWRSAAAAVLIALDAGLGAIAYARLAATWSAKNPAPLVAFIDAHVPDGAAVAGPDQPFFLAVEQSGARYRSVSETSVADWARWVPLISPEAVRSARAVPTATPVARFLLWRYGDELPQGYECVRNGLVAIYEPPRHHLDRLGWLGARTADAGYPRSLLYRLGPGCPTGYDPTRPSLVSN